MKNIFHFFGQVEKNIRSKTTNEALRSFKDDEAAFYTHIAFSQIQTDGLMVGINFNSERKMDLQHLYLVNADGQIPEFSVLFKNYKPKKQALERFKMTEEEINSFDVKRLYERFNTTDIKKLYLKILEQGHCSVFMKLIKDGNGNIKDLIASHSTWDEYTEMLRIFKKYDFELGGDEKNTILKPIDVTFSSYPGKNNESGVLISTDDYYMTNKKLLVIETSLEILVL